MGSEAWAWEDVLCAFCAVCFAWAMLWCSGIWRFSVLCWDVRYALSLWMSAANHQPDGWRESG